MPQFNPAPGFAILVLSWLIFLTVIPPKVLAHSFPNEPTSQSAKLLKTEPWSWLW
uniref:ATP synthase complex subunit 8 n=1 Tax=Hyporhamphus dussumieri TaxID=435156 RepID=A0A4D5YGL1_9TELE|nr:ATP synthase F0 subunit 8 [Hyporhamphus dussumieri]QBS54632.1 ATPase subunit 8 [Hyporhamphus dussumieri]